MSGTMESVRRFFSSMADAFDAWAVDVAARAQRREDEAYARGLDDGRDIERQITAARGAP